MNPRSTRFGLLVTAIAILMASAAAAAAPGDADPTWSYPENSTPGYVADQLLTDSQRRVIAVSGDYYSETLARLTSSGAVDLHYPQAAGWLASGAGRGAVVPGDGVVRAGHSGGVQMVVHRWLADGTVDRTFGGDGQAVIPLAGVTVESVAGLPDGSVLVAGETNYRAYVLKLTRNGVLDASWAASSTTPGIAFDVGGAYLLMPTADGGALVSGRCPVTCLTRLTAVGQRDSSYGDNGTAPGLGAQYSLILGAGSVSADGAATVYGVDTVAHQLTIARYTSTGQLDNSVGTGGLVTHPIARCTSSCNLHVSAIAAAPTGEVYVATWGDDNRVYRLLSDASLDATFGQGGSVTQANATSLRAVALDATNNLIVAFDGRLSALQTGVPAPSPSPSPSASLSPSPSPSPLASETPSPSSSPTAAHQVPAVTVSPYIVKFGQSAFVTIHGTPGALVDLYIRKYRMEFVKIRDGVMLDSSGAAVVATKPDVNLRFQARDRTVEQGSSIGGTAGLMTVEKNVSINVRRTGTRRYVFSGSINPSHPGATVSLYCNGTLVRSGIPVDGSRIYSLTTALPAGTYSFQVRSATSGYNSASASPLRSVHIY